MRTLFIRIFGRPRCGHRFDPANVWCVECWLKDAASL